MDLATMMEEERNRLLAKLEDIAKRRVELDQEEGSINTELSALTAYFDMKLGKVTARQTQNAPKVRKPRTPRDLSVKQSVLAVIRNNNGHAMTKQEIIEAMNAQDNKTLQGGISNALAILKKDGMLLSPERGKYQKPGPYGTGEFPTDKPVLKVKRVPKDDTPTP